MLLLLKRSGYGQDVLNLYGSSAEGVTVLVCQRYSYSIDAATLVIKDSPLQLGVATPELVEHRPHSFSAENHRIRPIGEAT